VIFFAIANVNTSWSCVGGQSNFLQYNIELHVFSVCNKYLVEKIDMGGWERGNGRRGRRGVETKGG
jgi:hypothetical protein